jgi:hypothetical protein
VFVIGGCLGSLGFAVVLSQIFLGGCPITTFLISPTPTGRGEAALSIATVGDETRFALLLGNPHPKIWIALRRIPKTPLSFFGEVFKWKIES